MKLVLDRKENNGKACTGDLFVNGLFFCHTLEDPVRADGVKIQDETAIPAGTYRVIVNMSPRLRKLYPRLLDVPMFTGILIHSGNDAIDTKGCILVGHTIQPGAERIIGGSTVFLKLLEELKRAQAVKEVIYIEVNNKF